MSSPKILINTFVNTSTKPKLDVASKIYIVIESLFGLNRLFVFKDFSIISKILIILYCLFINTCIATILYEESAVPFYIRVLDYMEFFLCALLGGLYYKKIEQFFRHLERYDFYVNYKYERKHLVDSVLLYAVIGVVIMAFVTCIILTDLQGTPLRIMMIRLLYCIELSFYGHLLSIMIPRLRLISRYVEQQISNKERNESGDVFTGTPLHASGMNIFDLYEILIQAFDSIVEAIQWPFLVTLTFSFLTTLTSFFHLSFVFMETAEYLQLQYSTWVVLVLYVCVNCCNSVTLFVSCFYGERLSASAARLRALLASWLLDEDLDKRSRRTGRCLLGLARERDLALVVMGMVRLDSSLALKYVRLLVSYLIILLQFKKIIYN